MDALAVDNPCGGLNWATLPDGTIEIEGEGVPVYEPGSEPYRMLEQTWQNWADEFNEVAERRGLLPSWLVAIAAQESGPWSKNPESQRTISSTDGFSSIGIMQPIPATARAAGYSPDDRYDPLSNIDIGGFALEQKIKTSGDYGFPLAAAGYNSGKTLTSVPNICSIGRDEFGFRVAEGSRYTRHAITYNNTAILSLGTGVRRAGVGFGVVLFALSAAAFAGWQWLRRRR